MNILNNDKSRTQLLWCILIILLVIGVMTQSIYAATPLLFLFSSGGGGSSSSRPATGAERLDVFNAGIKGIGSQLPYAGLTAYSGGTGGTGANAISAGNKAGQFANAGGGTTGAVGAGTGPTFNYPVYQPGAVVDPGAMSSYTSPGAPLTFGNLMAAYASPSPNRNNGYVSPGVSFSDGWGSRANVPQTFQMAGESVPAVTTGGSVVPTFSLGGNYSDLYNSIVAARTAPLERYETLQRQNLNEDLAKRGIWASPVALAAQNNLTEALLPQYQQTGAEAATQTYGLMANEMQNLNQYNLTSANQANTFANMLGQYNLAKAGLLTSANQNIAQQQYASAWQPFEWLQGLFNSTGGTFSNASQGGAWSIL